MRSEILALITFIVFPTNVFSKAGISLFFPLFGFFVAEIFGLPVLFNSVGMELSMEKRLLNTS